MLEKLKSLRWKPFFFACLFAIPLFTGAVIATTVTYPVAADNHVLGWALFLPSLLSCAYFFCLPWVVLLKPLNEVRNYFGLTDSQSGE